MRGWPSSSRSSRVRGAPFHIDPATAAFSPAVGDTLQAYRQDGRLNGAVTFGVNAIVVQGDGLLLRVGQAVCADFRFD